MRKISLVPLLVALFSLAAYAQDNNTTVVKRVVEKSSLYNKRTYNILLLEQIDSADQACINVEGQVQRIWWGDKTVDMSEVCATGIARVDSCINTVTKTRVYVGGEEYRDTVLEYMQAVKGKIESLRNYGIEATLPEPDNNKLDELFALYEQATDKAQVIRETMKQKKDIYERTFIIER